MAVNTVAFKKSMLAWDAVAKKAPGDVAAAGKAIAAEHPEVVKQVAMWSSQLTTMNDKLRHALDEVINAKDDKARATVAKTALATVKQYQGFVTSTHLPGDVRKRLSGGLAELAKGLGG